MTDRPDQDAARRVLGLIDLTLLDEQCAPADIVRLCQLAANRHHAPAALCVWPHYVAQARTLLDRLCLSRVAVATVVNFPDGSEDAERIEHELAHALAAGADEIDAVLPYRALLRNELEPCAAMLQLCRRVCGGNALLKVIIESGELGSAERVAQASDLAIAAGADFIKTSTGKTPVSATLAAAEVMLERVHAHGGRCGFKASGGVRTLAQALPYLDCAERRLGRDWIGPARFRFGASALLHDVLAALEGEPAEQ